MTQAEMDILEFLEVFGKFKKAILTVQDRENAGNFSWADKSQEKANALQVELQDRWATCSSRLKELPFQELPVSVGPIETTLGEWLNVAEEL